MINNIVYNPDRATVKSAEHYKGMAIEYHIDANYWATREGGALSSATWSVLEGDASIGSNTEASNVSKALITTGSEGESLVQIKLLLDASGSAQIGMLLLRLHVPLTEKAGIKY